MKLKCRINGKEYDIVQGASFTDNLNETLDSGTICIDQVPEITGLKPYDDVYIWDSKEEFDGYFNIGDISSTDNNIVQKTVTSTTEILSKISNNDVVSYGIFKKGIDFLEKDNDKYEKTLYGSFIDILCDLAENGYNKNNKNLFRYRVPDIKLTGTKAIEKDGNIVGIEQVSLEFQPFEISFDTGESKISENPIFLFQDSSGTTDRINCTLDLSKKVLKVPSVSNNGIVFTKLEIDQNSSVSKNDDFSINLSVLFDKTFTITSQVQEIQFFGKILGDWFLFSSTLEKVGGPLKLMNIKLKLFNNEENFSISFSSSQAKLKINTNNLTSYLFTQLDDIKIGNFIIKISQNSSLPKNFYKHMLVDSFNKQRLNLGNEYSDNKVLYKYTINLFSETKRLEKIILPNITITQSLKNNEKRSCWFYLENFLELYSPKYKKVYNSYHKEWKYVQKYSISQNFNEYLENGKTQFVTNLKEVFENTICPEMSWTSPSLRDVLNQIFIVKDLIPVVFNDVIYGLNIGALDEELPIFDRNGVNFDISSMSSSDYATDARRQYGGALSQENSAHLIEYMGFRSPDGSPFLNLSTMRVETRFPIYKINTIKLCFYKKYLLLNTKTQETKNKVFMCKYDITPLVYQNSVRNTLSVNYKDFDKDINDIFSTNDNYEEKMNKISKYKFCTIGYDIGSNVIEGWGETYEYLKFLWFKEGRTYIENLLLILQNVNGEGSETFLSEIKDFDSDWVPVFNPDKKDIFEQIVILGENSSKTNSSNNSTNLISKLKSIVFEIDYDAMYSGVVIHGKDYIDDDDITTVDNCSSSLPILEIDGLFEKEKLNRMSNQQFKFMARYDDFNGGSFLSQVQPIGCLDKNYTNSTIYSREYQIFDNCILANYSATYNYILKNYFTSVWAKYRTYSYMSYGESVKRAENRRQLVLLSTKKQYYEQEGTLLDNNPQTFTNLFSFINENEYNDYKILPNKNVINCGYFVFNGNSYLSDINSFASGNSVCFNISTYSNISGGSKIVSLSSDYTVNNLFLEGIDSEKAKQITEDYKAIQDWYNISNSVSDAFIEKVGVYFCHLDIEKAYGALVVDDNGEKFGENLKNLPMLSEDLKPLCSNIIGKEFILNKDNKETIDFTLQFDYILDDKNTIVFSPWIAKLNDLIGTYRKLENKTELVYDEENNLKLDFYLYENGKSVRVHREEYTTGDQNVILKMSKSFIDDNIISNKLNEQGIEIANAIFETENEWDIKTGSTSIDNTRVQMSYELVKYRFKLSLKRITECGELELIPDSEPVKYLKIECDWKSKATTYDHYVIWGGGDNYYYSDLSVNPEKSKTNGGIINLTFVLPNINLGESNNEDDNYYYFSSTINKEDVVMLETKNANNRKDHLTPYIPKKGPEKAKLVNNENSLYLGNSLGLIGNVVLKQYEGNMFVITSPNKIEQKSSYNSYSYIDENQNNLPYDLTIEKDKNVSNVFSLSTDIPTILVKSSLFSNDVNSIQYWYKNNDRLNFVFGINVEKDEAGNNKDMTIYLSCISKRSMKVYDNNHNVIGYAVNYADPDNEFQYGTGQYYKEIE